MAELLDGVVLDDSRNALGRQRIAHIRDELRAYDRQHQAPPLTKTPRCRAMLDWGLPYPSDRIQAISDRTRSGNAQACPAHVS
ncbi:hypothetical protein G6F68_020564 [Rhizopus microsporus]|nr:hypothetical protein G6F68_020564 [Rhizopus microsporus]